jgi:hypothetical protein
LVLGHVSDGDAKLRKAYMGLLSKVDSRGAIKVFDGGRSALTIDHPLIHIFLPPSLDAPIGGIYEFNVVVGLSDFLHLAWRLRVHFLWNHRHMFIGSLVILATHVREAQAATQSRLRIKNSDLNVRDKQNWAGTKSVMGFDQDGVAFEKPMFEFLHGEGSSQQHYATYMYLGGLCHRFLRVFIGRPKKPHEVVKDMAFCLAFIAFWRQINVEAKCANVSRNFLTRQTFTDLIITCSAMILMIKLWSVQFRHLPFVPGRMSSRFNEYLFSYCRLQVRGAPIFTALGALRHLRAYIRQVELELGAGGIVEVRKTKRGRSRGIDGVHPNKGMFRSEDWPEDDDEIVRWIDEGVDECKAMFSDFPDGDDIIATLRQKDFSVIGGFVGSPVYFKGKSVAPPDAAVDDDDDDPPSEGDDAAAGDENNEDREHRLEFEELLDARPDWSSSDRIARPEHGDGNDDTNQSSKGGDRRWDDSTTSATADGAASGDDGRGDYGGAHRNNSRGAVDEAGAEERIAPDSHELERVRDIMERVAGGDTRDDCDGDPQRMAVLLAASLRPVARDMCSSAFFKQSYNRNERFYGQTGVGNASAESSSDHATTIISVGDSAAFVCVHGKRIWCDVARVSNLVSRESGRAGFRYKKPRNVNCIKSTDSTAKMLLHWYDPMPRVVVEGSEDGDRIYRLAIRGGRAPVLYGTTSFVKCVVLDRTWPDDDLFDGVLESDEFFLMRRVQQKLVNEEMQRIVDGRIGFTFTSMQDVAVRQSRRARTVALPAVIAAPRRKRRSVGSNRDREPRATFAPVVGGSGIRGRRRPGRRHCGICRMPGHDKRKCPKTVGNALSQSRSSRPLVNNDSSSTGAASVWGVSAIHNKRRRGDSSHGGDSRDGSDSGGNTGGGSRSNMDDGGGDSSSDDNDVGGNSGASSGSNRIGHVVGDRSSDGIAGRTRASQRLQRGSGGTDALPDNLFNLPDPPRMRRGVSRR